MSLQHRLVLAYPGDLEARTGGYLYDRRLALELEARGWQVERLSLPTCFPFPTRGDLAAAAEAFATDPDYAPFVAARQGGSESRFQLIDDTDLAGTIPYLRKG